MTVVEEIRQRVDERIAELEPLIAEYRELVAVKEGLGAAAGESSARDRRPRAKASGGRRPGRAEQALEMVTAKPGVTVKEIAAQMGINENYLYRLLPRMEKAGMVARHGKGWART